MNPNGFTDLDLLPGGEGGHFLYDLFLLAQNLHLTPEPPELLAFFGGRAFRSPVSSSS